MLGVYYLKSAVALDDAERVWRYDGVEAGSKDAPVDVSDCNVYCWIGCVIHQSGMTMCRGHHMMNVLSKRTKAVLSLRKAVECGDVGFGSMDVGVWIWLVETSCKLIQLFTFL